MILLKDMLAYLPKVGFYCYDSFLYTVSCNYSSYSSAFPDEVLLPPGQAENIKLTM